LPSGRGIRPVCTIALNKIGENLEGLKSVLATRDTKQAQSHSQPASQAIALICEHEESSVTRKCSHFEIFNKDPVQACGYLSMPKKEWWQYGLRGSWLTLEA